MARISLLGLIALIAVLPVEGAAQARLTGADLNGTVFDQQGRVVPGCAITVTNVDTNVTRHAATGGDGRYVVAALPPGTYRVRAALAGFATQNRADVVLLLGQAVTISFTLAVAATAEVVVTASIPLVQVSRTEVSSVVNQQQIDNLPINGRNFISFSVLTPGVAPDHTPQQGASATTGLSFAGQRARSNNIMVDGLDNNDPVVGSVRATFSQEAVREFQVLADSYSAEFGKAAGGVVNIATKSGTNVVHGNSFIYLRDRTLNAKSYFDRFDLFGNPVARDKPPFKQHQAGATLGGPLQKNQTFLFLSYEHTDIADSRLVTINQDAVAALSQAGFPIDAGYVPLNVTNGEWLGKVDHQWRSGHSLVARGNFADINREGIDDFGGIVARSRGTAQVRTDWSLSAAQTDIVSHDWVNEFRVQYARQNQSINALDPLCGPECTESNQGGPTLELTGVASVGRQRFTPNRRLNSRLQVVDTVSYFSGAHHAKIGLEYNDISFPGHGNELPLHFGGRYIFSAIPALGVTSALDGLQKGIPATYVQGYGNSIYPESWYADVSIFAQDEWTRGRLVVKPGVRYQRQFWDPFTYNVSDLGGSTFSYPLPSDNNNVAPRVAVAYDVTGDGRTAVHGSYGVFYDNIVTAVPSVGRLITGAVDGIRTLVLPAPRASVAWNAPGHRLGEDQARALLGGSYVSTVIALDPSLKNSYTHQVAAGVDRALSEHLALSVNGIWVRGFNMPGTLDYNPVLPSRLGAGRRPNDAPCSSNPAATCVGGGIPGTSASVLQYTSFGESWYRGLTAALTKRLSDRYQYLLSYTLSKAEDTSTDFQTNFIAQNSGFGRNPDDKFGLPLGFDPLSERGPATHDQRHRFVASGVYVIPSQIVLSGIVTAASGRPFTPLAGADLNGDGNGGTFPPDRARLNPATESSSVGRNSATTAAQYNVDMRVSRKFSVGRHAALEGICDVFNVLNRANFFEDTNQSSFVIFGSGAFPTSPLPTYGRYTLMLPPRQIQLAAKLSF
jgi:hypothetical protein